MKVIYSTCKFSQLLDFESRAQTRPSNPFTLRLADVRDPRYFLGLMRGVGSGERINKRRNLPLLPYPSPGKYLLPPSLPAVRTSRRSVDEAASTSRWARNWSARIGAATDAGQTDGTTQRRTGSTFRFTNRSFPEQIPTNRRQVVY